VKKLLVVDINVDRKPPINIYDNSPNMNDPIGDMSILCDAICVLIHGCNKLGLQKDYISLQNCIKQLEEGFIDTELTATVLTDGSVRESINIPTKQVKKKKDPEEPEESVEEEK